MSLRQRSAQNIFNGNSKPADQSNNRTFAQRTGKSEKAFWNETITYEESSRLLPWQTDNDHIRTGYRRQIESISGCIWSAFAFLHNETVNIHSHSVGAVFFAILIPLHLFPDQLPTFGLSYDPLPTPPTLHDKIALCFTLVCAVACLGLSSSFHTVQCHSRRICDIAHRGDYLGIVILTCGTIISGIYYSFHGDLFLQITYTGFITLAGLATSYTVLSPAQRAHRWRRTLAFIALGLTTILPMAHVTLTHGLAYARERVGLDFVLAAGASYITGAVLYAARVPERFSPGTFDIFGASHQIFHLFVLGGVTFSYAALRNMVWGRAIALSLVTDDT